MMEFTTVGIFLGKAAAAVILPAGLTLVLLAAAWTQAFRGRGRSSRHLIAAAFIVIGLSSSPVFSDLAIATVERLHPPVPIERLPKADVAILLGGGLRDLKPPRLEIEFDSAGNRVLHAARLYRAGKVSRIIVTGGSHTNPDDPVVEADLTRTLLIEWGVPDAAILLERRSRTTHENALFTRDIWAREGVKSGLLVTSASHMPRALAAFARVGLTLSPASVDVHAVESNYSIYDVIPSGDAVRVTSYAAREWIGRIGYALFRRGA